MSDYVGQQFRARVLMELPGVGAVKPGGTFTFTAAMAEQGVQPDVWLQVGNAELVRGKDKSKSKQPAKPTPAKSTADASRSLPGRKAGD